MVISDEILSPIAGPDDSDVVCHNNFYKPDNVLAYGNLNNQKTSNLKEAVIPDTDMKVMR